MLLCKANVYRYTANLTGACHIANKNVAVGLSLNSKYTLYQQRLTAVIDSCMNIYNDNSTRFKFTASHVQLLIVPSYSETESETDSWKVDSWETITN